MRSVANAFLVAVQFMTIVPVATEDRFGPDTLAKSAVYFPLVGLLVGAGGVGLNWALSPYVPHNVAILIVLAYVVIITGGLHDDALGDAVDGFGGGWERNQILEIMHDSRIGSFGAIAITLCLLARFIFLSNIPQQKFAAFLVAGQVVSRWTSLPLAYFLASARGPDGRPGSSIAEKISGLSLIAGTVLTVALVAGLLRASSLWVLPVAGGTTIACGLYFRSRIGGVTGDCLGATIQLTEVAVYLAGVVLH